MLQRILLACLLGVTSLSAWAISPYIPGDRVQPGKLAAVAAEVEKKLTAEGFQVLGLYAPKYLPTHGVVVATDAGMLDKIRAFGGTTIVAAPIRVGLRPMARSPMRTRITGVVPFWENALRRPRRRCNPCSRGWRRRWVPARVLEATSRLPTCLNTAT